VRKSNLNIKKMPRNTRSRGSWETKSDIKWLDRWILAGENFFSIPFSSKNPVQNARNTIYLGTSDGGRYTRAKIREKKIHVSRYNLCAAVTGFSNQKNSFPVPVSFLGSGMEEKFLKRIQVFLLLRPIDWVILCWISFP